eukprot:6492328-Amphidinium_carterae.3
MTVRSPGRHPAGWMYKHIDTDTRPQRGVWLGTIPQNGKHVNLNKRANCVCLMYLTHRRMDASTPVVEVALCSSPSSVICDGSASGTSFVMFSVAPLLSSTVV